MTKAEVEALIEAKLNEATLITPQLHKDALKNEPNSILNAIYTTPILDTQETNNIFQKDPSFVGTYSIRTMKIGNSVFINGVVKKNNSGGNFFAFTDLAEYLPIGYPFFVGNCVGQNSNSNPDITFFGNNFANNPQVVTRGYINLVNNIPGDVVMFSLTYFVQE